MSRFGVLDKSIKTTSFIDVFFPFYVILSAYSVFSVFSDYGTVILILYMIISFFKNKKLYVYKPLLNFVIVTKLIFVFGLYFYGGFNLASFYNTIVPFLQILIIASIAQNINFNFFYRWYAIVGIICSLVIIIQAINLYVFGNPAVPITILPIPLEDYHYWGDFVGERPSAFFSEPQAFASFIIPLLILSFIYKKHKLSFLIGIAILMSGSSLGTGLLLIISLKFSLEVKYKKTLIFWLILISFFTYMFLTLDLFESSREKFLRIDLTDDIRLVRGFIVISTFGFQELLFGIGDNLYDYIITNLNFLWVDEHIKSGTERLIAYTTSISGLIIRYGLLGGYLYLSLLRKIYKIDKSPLRFMIVIILLLSFSQTIVYNNWFVFYFAIYFSNFYKTSEFSNKNFYTFKL